MNFWDQLFTRKKWILGLSPMDGVTDVAMRYMTAKYSSTPVPQYASGEWENKNTGKPKHQIGGVDVMFTEFVNVDALHYAEGERRERLMKTLLRAKDINSYSRDPVNSYSSREQKRINGLTDVRMYDNWPYEIAQVFGKNPELFAEAASLIEQLGFDGIDINMGCPAHKVEENGCGAGLIRHPALAQEIIRTVQKTTKLPVSVKTRIGVIDKSEMEEWMEVLMEVKPAIISLHGRTLKQMYTGSADWEVIGRAAEIVHKRGGRILGNGDVTSVASAKLKVESYGVDGVLIGRAAEGNPKIFIGSQSSDHSLAQGLALREQRLKWALEHAILFEKIFGKDKSFMPMRKNLAWYCKGFEGAVELRMKLMQTNSAREVEEVINNSQLPIYNYQ